MRALERLEPVDVNCNLEVERRVLDEWCVALATRRAALNTRAVLTPGVAAPDWAELFSVVAPFSKILMA